MTTVDKKIFEYIKRAKVIEDKVNSIRQSSIGKYMDNVLAIARMIQLEELSQESEGK